MYQPGSGSLLGGEEMVNRFPYQRTVLSSTGEQEGLVGWIVVTRSDRYCCRHDCPTAEISMLTSKHGVGRSSADPSEESEEEATEAISSS